MTAILTITVNPAVDLSTEAPAVIPDRKLRCSAPRVQPGGGGVNVSRAIANLGGVSRTLLAFGGPTGMALTNALRAEGLDVRGLGVDHPTRQSLSVRDAANGLQYRFMMPGPDWTESDCATARSAILQALEPGALVIPSGSYPPGLPDAFFVDLNRNVAAAGGRIILDTSGSALRAAARTDTGLFALRMDHEEAQELSGARLKRLDDIADYASWLHRDTGSRIVMIAAGAMGTVIVTPDWRGLLRPPVVVPVSKVGAGDSFVGGFALALSRGDDPVSACAWGVAAAASAVTTPDTDLCDRADVERFVTEVTRSAL
jgi:6-phosphofructokinase 2